MAETFVIRYKNRVRIAHIFTNDISQFGDYAHFFIPSRAKTSLRHRLFRVLDLQNPKINLTETEMMRGYAQERIENQIKHILPGRMGKYAVLAFVKIKTSLWAMSLSLGKI